MCLGRSENHVAGLDQPSAAPIRGGGHFNNVPERPHGLQKAPTVREGEKQSSCLLS